MSVCLDANVGLREQNARERHNLVLFRDSLATTPMLSSLGFPRRIVLNDLVIAPATASSRRDSHWRISICPLPNEIGDLVMLLSGCAHRGD